MKIDWKKVMFHALTNVNADVSYYGEIYLEKNNRWIMTRPVTFAWNLLKIRIHYRKKTQTRSLRLTGMNEVDMRKIYYRHQSSVTARSLMRYKHMILDVWGSLLVPLLEEDSLYEVIEKKLEVEGFAKIRKKYQNNEISIEEIYAKISRELHLQLTPDLELSIIKQTVQTNAYLKEVLEALSTNHIPMIGVINSCYPREIFLEILREKGIPFLTEVHVTSEFRMNIKKMVMLFAQNYKNADPLYHRGVVIYSGDYENYVKHQRKRWYTAFYYPVPERFLAMHPLPKFHELFGTVYKKIVAMGIYSGFASHSDVYKSMYLYVAPVVCGLLQEIRKRSKGREVVFLGPGEHGLVTLFHTFFGQAAVVEWSYVAANMPKEDTQWQDIFEKMPSLCTLTEDSIGYAMNFTAPAHTLGKSQDEFILYWNQYQGQRASANEIEKGISKYIQSYFDDGNTEKEIFLVDITEGCNGQKSFEERIRAIYPDRKVEYFSLSRLFSEVGIEQEKQEELKTVLYSFDHILQMDSPILIQILEEEISYVQPPVFPVGKKELFLKILEEYIRTMKPLLDEDVGIPNISGEEMFELLYAGKDEIVQLKRRMMEQ